MTGRVAVPCSGCGRTVAFLSTIAIEKSADFLPIMAAHAIAARFMLRREPAKAMGLAADHTALRCCECEASAIADAAAAHSTK